MALDAQAARFFPADDDRLALHVGADVFETDRGFVHFHAEQLYHRIKLMARGHGPDDGAGPSTIFLQSVNVTYEEDGQKRKHRSYDQARSFLKHLLVNNSPGIQENHLDIEQDE